MNNEWLITMAFCWNSCPNCVQDGGSNAQKFKEILLWFWRWRRIWKWQKCVLYMSSRDVISSYRTGGASICNLTDGICGPSPPWSNPPSPQTIITWQTKKQKNRLLSQKRCNRFQKYRSNPSCLKTIITHHKQIFSNSTVKVLEV